MLSFEDYVDKFHEQLLNWDPLQPSEDRKFQPVPLIFGDALDYINTFSPLILKETTTQLLSAFHQDEAGERGPYPSLKIPVVLKRVENSYGSTIRLDFHRGASKFNMFEYLSLRFILEKETKFLFGLIFKPRDPDLGAFSVKLKGNCNADTLKQLIGKSCDAQALGKISPSHRMHASVQLSSKFSIPVFGPPLSRDQQYVYLFENMKKYLKVHPVSHPVGKSKAEQRKSPNSYKKQFISLCSNFCPYTFSSEPHRKRGYSVSIRVFTHTFPSYYSDNNADAFEKACQGFLAWIESFDGTLPFTPTKEVPREITHFDRLNESQRTAIERIHDMNQNLTIVQGPPGTGKTTTIVSALTHFYKSGDRVLITAPSNSAVCEVIHRVLQKNEISSGDMTLYGMGNSIDLSGPLQNIFFDTKVTQIRQLVESLLSLMTKVGGKFDYSEVMECVEILIQEFDVVYSEIIPKSHKSQIHSDLRRPLDTIISVANKSQENNVWSPNAREEKFLEEKSKWLLRRVSEDESRIYYEKLFLQGAQFVFCTLTQCSTATIRERSGSFKVAIVDEAAQSTEPQSVLPLLLPIEKCVLIGDPKQLGPVIQSRVVAESGFENSFMTRLMKIGHEATLLKVQYRMHPDIANWPSLRFYNGEVETAAYLEKKNTFVPIIFIDVANSTEKRTATSYFNMEEARCVFDVASTIIKSGILPSSIGIITFYSSQLSLLTERLASLGVTKVRTVDGFQGQEEEVIILSFVRSNSTGTTGFVNEQRLNVALTRAKQTLVMIGNRRTLEQSSANNSMFKDLLSKVPEIVTFQPGLNMQRCLTEPALLNQEEIRKKKRAQEEQLLLTQRRRLEEARAMAIRFQQELERVRNTQTQRFIAHQKLLQEQWDKSWSEEESEIPRYRIEERTTEKYQDSDYYYDAREYYEGRSNDVRERSDRSNHGDDRSYRSRSYYRQYDSSDDRDNWRYESSRHRSNSRERRYSRSDSYDRMEHRRSRNRSPKRSSHNSDRELDKRDRERSYKRSRSRDKDKTRDKNRDRHNERSRSESTERPRRRSKDRDKNRDREKDRDRRSERSRSRDKDKNRDKNRDKRSESRNRRRGSRSNDKEKNRDRERNRDSTERNHRRSRSNDKDKNRRSRTPKRNSRSRSRSRRHHSRSRSSGSSRYRDTNRDKRSESTERQQRSRKDNDKSKNRDRHNERSRSESTERPRRRSKDRDKNRDREKNHSDSSGSTERHRRDKNRDKNRDRSKESTERQQRSRNKDKDKNSDRVKNRDRSESTERRQRVNQDKNRDKNRDERSESRESRRRRSRSKDKNRDREKNRESKEREQRSSNEKEKRTRERNKKTRSSRSHSRSRSRSRKSNRR